jgi:CIC family chloride channel protein
MTAVTMIFEMTRDYEIVMPMIVAVAVAIGVRRMLSAENIYTIKLVARRHFIPKAMHANMFLVRPVSEVMERDFLLLPQDTGFDEFLRMPEQDHRLRHIVVTDGERIVGTLRVNTALRQGLEGAYTGVTLGSLANERYTVAQENDIMFDVITRFWRRKALMTVVVRPGHRVPRASDVVGVVTKEHIADSVAESVKPYGAAGDM